MVSRTGFTLLKGDAVRLLVDGNEVRHVPADGPPLAQVYRELVGGLFLDGRAVVAVTLDGRTLEDDELTTLLDGEQGGSQTMDLKTVDTGELSRSTLTEVTRHLDHLHDGLKLTVDHLGRGERGEGLGALRPTLEIWLAVCEAVQKVCVLQQIDVADELDDAGVGGLQQSLLRSLTDIQSAVEQEDWVRLGDLLEYELLPSVVRWKTLVNALLDRLKPDRKA